MRYLARIVVERIDLYQVHQPNPAPLSTGPRTPGTSMAALG